MIHILISDTIFFTYLSYQNPIKNIKQSMIEIRRAVQSDHDEIWDIIKEVIATGDSRGGLADSTRQY